MRRFGAAAVVALALAACGDDPAEFETLLRFDEAIPGDVVALRADGARVEYVDRRAGRIVSVNVDDPADVETLAEIDVSVDGEQRGLLGHTVIDGPSGSRRFAAWTDPDTLDLVVGEVTTGVVDRIVWEGTGTQSKAVGGHLETDGGNIVLGIGSLTDWANDHGSGAIVRLDPDGEPAQAPFVITDGWNNPFAFTIVDGEIWVADNAPDGSNLPVDEREGERIARATPGRPDLGPSFVEPPPQRAPSAIASLTPTPDSGPVNRSFGVCGFLDNELRRYAVEDDTGGGDTGEAPLLEGITLDRAGTIGPCQSGVAVMDDGSIVTVSVTDDGTPALLIRRP